MIAHEDGNHRQTQQESHQNEQPGLFEAWKPRLTSGKAPNKTLKLSPDCHPGTNKPRF